jgi:hypothetical protein
MCAAGFHPLAKGVRSHSLDQVLTGLDQHFDVSVKVFCLFRIHPVLERIFIADGRSRTFSTAVHAATFFPGNCRGFAGCADACFSAAPQAILHRYGFAFMGSHHTAYFPALTFAGWRPGVTSIGASFGVFKAAGLSSVPTARLWLSTLPTMA